MKMREHTSRMKRQKNAGTRKDSTPGRKKAEKRWEKYKKSARIVTSLF
ncbi:hypothetical protein [Methanosarcina sp.]